MCGRYTLRTTAEEVVAAFRLANVEMPELRARYNVAPTDPVPIVRIKDEERCVKLVRWGLIPVWNKQPKPRVRPINAKSETVATSGMFRGPFNKRRCLVLADGFIEWRREGKKRLPIHYTLPGQRLFAFAGIWERWKQTGTELGPEPWIKTCAILTTAANELVEQVHGRMPVILPVEAHEIWLDPKAPKETLLQLLRPFPAEAMDATPISTRVNNVRNDDEACLEPRAV